MLTPVVVGARVEALLVRRAGLRLPFPDRFEERLVGQTVTALSRRAKYLVATLRSGETLVVHLGMTGWFRVERAAAEDGLDVASPSPDDDPRHDHVVLRLSGRAIVTFNDPRRFGLMDLVPAAALAHYAPLQKLGPEPLSVDFDASALARACHRKKTPLKVALLDQRVVAGVGNIYASEALFDSRLSPRRLARTIVTPAGAPKPAARQLAASTVKVLSRAIDHPTARFKVYERAGSPCPRRGCDGVITRIVQAGRSTFYCPTCQR
jgi:formamidopyrimidine-DNA glycosylase